MRNILAIAGKELRGYFSSPIAYVVIGLFAYVLIIVTISMVCAVFAPVWAEWRQGENDRTTHVAESADVRSKPETPQAPPDPIGTAASR